MAKPFKAFSSEGSSWADDDDDIEVPLPIAPPKLPEVAEKDQPEEEAPARDLHHRSGDDHRGARHDRDHDDGHHDNRRGGNHDDRRGDRDHNERRGGGGGGGGSGGGYNDRPKNPLPDHPPYKLYVGNLSFHSIEDDIADFFGDHDTIRSIVLPVDHVSNRPKGFAYVEFSTREALERAMSLDGQVLDRREVRLDVASERPARQDRSSNFFEKRDGRSRGNDRERPAPAPRERPHFSLLPRSTSTTESSDDVKKPSIFGEAKPRDESVYQERQKARELERKQAKELERKQAKEAKELARKKSVDEGKAAEGGEKKQGPPSRKNSHDDGHGLRAGGRGGTRGGRGERPGRGEARSGRGGEHSAAGRGGRDAPHSAKKEHPKKEQVKKEQVKKEQVKKEQPKEPEAAASTASTPAPASSRKSEPRAKRTEPAKVKITAPAPAKVVNAFAALGVDDSDSD